MSPRRITVVGLGLIGGSIAASARRAGRRVRGVDPDAATIGYAIEQGIVDEAATPDDAEGRGWFTGDQGLLVLATPVIATVAWLERLAESGYAGIVTDVASTKRAVIEQNLLAFGKAHFGIFAGQGHALLQILGQQQSQSHCELIARDAALFAQYQFAGHMDVGHDGSRSFVSDHCA